MKLADWQSTNCLPVLIPTVSFQTFCRETPGGGGGGALLCFGYIGMCGPKGYGFSAVLVINRASILADFGHFDHKQGIVFLL